MVLVNNLQLGTLLGFPTILTGDPTKQQRDTGVATKRNEVYDMYDIYCHRCEYSRF